MEWRKLILN